MSRRGRAVAFLLFALIAAALACAAAGSPTATARAVARRYGPLRPVVVAGDGLPAGKPIGPAEVARLQVRRVPARFVPPGALATPAEALGLVPTGRCSGAGPTCSPAQLAQRSRGR